MVMSPFEGSPPLEACTVDAILGRIYTIKEGWYVGFPRRWPSPRTNPLIVVDGLGGVGEGTSENRNFNPHRRQKDSVLDIVITKFFKLLES